MGTIVITIPEESESLNPSELAEFFYLFRAANLALGKIVPKIDYKLSREPSPKELKTYGKSLSSHSPGELNAFFNPNTAPSFLRIDQISKQSPLEIAMVGFGFLIVLGVIFSGGKIEIAKDGLKAELPPLGKGIKCLREALGLDKTLQAGFAIRETVIKLNKEEFETLCRQDDASRNNGGFQHFLVGLKYRVNKQTKELKLSENDLERIYRYKASPGKGGWQSRFKKIFGRHFPTSRLLK